MDNYKFNKDDVLYQVNVNKITYDSEYIEKYNNLGELGTRMAYLRLGYILGMGSLGPHAKNIHTVLDIGYGNGDFLKACNEAKLKTYGNDISGYHVPENTTFVENIYDANYDLVTMFDVLEHFDNIYDISKLKTKFILVTVPNCHDIKDYDNEDEFWDWFDTWKHRRPNEHLWHFNKRTLENFMNSINYELCDCLNIEDVIRKPDVGSIYPNTLTCLFQWKFT